MSDHSITGERRSVAVPIALSGGILAVSSGAIFVRFAQHDVPSLTIAACRLGLATLVLAPLALARHREDLAALRPRDVRPAALAGGLLAIHFATWIVSLEYTSVASSLVLVSTAPLWAALVSPLLLRERLEPSGWLGIAAALAGVTLVTLSDTPSAHMPIASVRWAGTRSGPAWLGDLLALAGAWAMAGYLIAGRRLRARLALVPYVFVVYGLAAAALIATALARGQRISDVPPGAWRWLLLLALVPQLLGHSTLNWALRHVPAPMVAVALLGEPIGAAALAWMFLGEVPTVWRATGAALVLAGIVWTATAGRRLPR